VHGRGCVLIWPLGTDRSEVVGGLLVFAGEKPVLSMVPGSLQCRGCLRAQEFIRQSPWPVTCP
jgi:hypothetical protein